MSGASSRDESSIRSSAFGTTREGRAVELYTLSAGTGLQASIATYGGTITTLTAPDRAGRLADIVLGFDTLEGYLQDSPYFGALIGRYANRIARGQFSLHGRTYQLDCNDGPNALHGGRVGFDKVVWSVVGAQVTREGPQLALEYLSRDGEEGYPGDLAVRAVYTLTRESALRLEYTARTDRATVLNLTQHSYFNLRGRGDVLGHVLQIEAGRFTPVDATMIPTGELREVAGTPFDFRTPQAIGARIGDQDEQLRFGQGYDHNWVLNGPMQLRRIASVYEPEYGRVLEVHSDQPGLQFYSGNLLDATIRGKRGEVYGARAALCLEPQHFPDSPNHPHFPSTVLSPGTTYHGTIVYRLGAR